MNFEVCVCGVCAVEFLGGGGGCVYVFACGTSLRMRLRLRSGCVLVAFLAVTTAFTLACGVECFVKPPSAPKIRSGCWCVVCSVCLMASGWKRKRSARGGTSISLARCVLQRVYITIRTPNITDQRRVHCISFTGRSTLTTSLQLFRGGSVHRGGLGTRACNLNGETISPRKRPHNPHPRHIIGCDRIQLPDVVVDICIKRK